MSSANLPGSKKNVPQSERKKGEGRGGKFFVLDRDHWAELWRRPTVNRLNFVSAFLVLLAGTGADHRFTKWSAKACEERVGIGKPRAKVAIDELIAAGLAERAETSRPAFPHYRLAEPQSGAEPIFLPIQLVTGLADETPVLRRVRETGDAMALKKQIDLYGMVDTDAPFGVPLSNLRLLDDSQTACRKLVEMGANTVWAVHLGGKLVAAGDWCFEHAVKRGSNEPDWSAFWDRLHTLQRLGALWFEPWVFDGAPLDSEPLYPVEDLTGASKVSVEAKKLSQLSLLATASLVSGRDYFVEQNLDRNFVILPTHHRPPAIRGVAKLRVEADTPGRRLAYAKRMKAVADQNAGLETLMGDIAESKFDRPIKLS